MLTTNAEIAAPALLSRDAAERQINAAWPAIQDYRQSIGEPPESDEFRKALISAICSSEKPLDEQCQQIFDAIVQNYEDKYRAA